jgi:hypothetical protein
MPAADATPSERSTTLVKKTAADGRSIGGAGRPQQGQESAFSWL